MGHLSIQQSYGTTVPAIAKSQPSGTLVLSYQRAHKLWLHREGKFSPQQQLVASASEVLLEFILFGSIIV